KALVDILVFAQRRIWFHKNYFWKRHSIPAISMASTLTTLLLLLALSAAAVSAQRNFTIVRYLNVTTTQGPIRGAVIETKGSGDKNMVHIGSFLGINFAKVPTGEFRFAHPVFTKWDFVQDVLDFDRRCYQDPGASGDYQTMSESCIAANIWTPYNGTSSNPGSYPVLVWIHGGRFETGSIIEEINSGRVLTAHESIVTVSLQYRLGVLGFLRLSSTVAPGNMGLKDQALGLEFVHKNIERFGGNLQTVTLMGLDAGAAAVGYHMLNDNTKTYFKRAVMLGGSPMVFWSVRQSTTDVERLHAKFAREKLNCDPDRLGLDEALKCLREVGPEALINAQKEFIKDFQGIEFPPVIDGDYIKEDPVVALRGLRFEPKQLIIGFTNSEAATYVESSLRDKGWSKEDLQDPAKYRSVIEDNFRTYEREPDIMSTAARKFMTDRFTSFSNPSAEVNFRRWLDAASDRLFVCAANEFADLSTRVTGQSVDVYFYVFSEQDNTPNYVGASHGSDAYYFFGNPTDDAPIVSPEQAQLSVRMMDYLSRFVATGDPVPRDNDGVWAKFNISQKYYHNFTADSSAGYNIKYGFHRDDCGFWDKTLKYVNSLQSTALAPAPEDVPKVRVVRDVHTNLTLNEAGICDNVVNATTLAIMIPLLISNVALLGALVWLLIKYNSLG
uniref:COesterase domain-containing protein n=1 Tax=Macrostomum lignano TaxID=282301 RepID=A0A1I8I8Y4_9PLAT